MALNGLTLSGVNYNLNFFRGGSTTYGSDSAFEPLSAVLNMVPQWETILAVTCGSDYIKSRGEIYLQKEPLEPDEAYARRLGRAVLAPYTVRLIENAAGLVLRRAIKIEGDPWWTEEFAKNVDGLGSGINEFARQRLVVALAYGHSAIMVDAPPSRARTRAEEIQEQRRPYWITVNPHQILGWRQASTEPYAPLSQMRILETITEPYGEYGEQVTNVVRVLTPGRYKIVKEDGSVLKSGTYNLNEIPVVPVYAQRTGVFSSFPPLLDIASLNIAHYQTTADQRNALRVAGVPLLVLEGWDDEKSTSGVNYALSMEPGYKAYYVQTDASAFQGQMDMLEKLEMQMSHLGITKLLGQKFVAESADAKRIDQQQANSVLAVISMELENALNQALRLTAQYVQKEPPVLSIDRDFDFYRLLGQDVSVLGDLREKGYITPKAFTHIMRGGEWLPDSVDIREEMTETEKLIETKKSEQQEMMRREMGNMAGPEALSNERRQPEPQANTD